MNRICYSAALASALVILIFPFMTGAQPVADERNSLRGDEIEFFGQLDLTLPQLAAVRMAVDSKDWVAAKAAWGEHLEESLAKRWIWSYRDRDSIMGYLNKHDPDFFQGAEARAKKVLRRKFGFQGVNRTLKKNILWESDEYEYEWGNVLNRHQYWKTLGEAWWQTRDEKYARDWAFMVHDWISDNPVPATRVSQGPWRSLESGIRAGVWLDAMSFFIDAPEFDASLRYDMTWSLVEHARYIYTNNARFRKGNWQTCECSGLAFIGIVLSEFKESAQWRKRAFEMMRKHMEEGVYPDGAQYELTPGYHYWVLREFLELMILADKNGYQLAGLKERHEKMFEFLMDISKPDKRYMPLGDAGKGKSIEEAMGRGAMEFGRPDMKYLAIETPAPGWVWYYPINKIDSYGEIPSREPTLRSHMLPYAKYGVMRTGWKKNDRWLLFDCAPWGGAHSHADQLQVLIYSGRDLLMDSGQIHYDNPISKSYFKTDVAHNILLVNGKGPARSIDQNPEVVTWSVNERVEFTAGYIIHDGVIQQRSVLFVKPDYWVVVDHVNGKSDVELTRLFHLPIVKVKRGENTVKTDFADGDNLWICAADKAKVEMREGLLAGGKNGLKAPVAAFVSKQSLPTALCTVLVPFGDENDIPSVEQLPTEDAGTAAICVRFRDGRTDWIAVAPGVRNLKAGVHSGRGIALCVRTGKKSTTVDILQPQRLEVDGNR